MQQIANHLESLIDRHIVLLKKIDLSSFAEKVSYDKWSKKEILGHLIDSAQNNTRRFVVSQYEDSPYLVYDQNKWVIASDYQKWDVEDLIDLWYLVNKQICTILRTMPAENHYKNCQTQSLHTLKWLAEDYVKHLLHHMHVILDLEPIAYP